MAADTLSLRDRIAQKVRGYVEHAGNEDSIAGAILPLVEQAIHIDVLRAALAEKDAQIAALRNQVEELIAKIDKGGTEV